jgi:hypothetical protein
LSDLPEPLTPADCDLRGLQFMPMDTIRVVDSDLFAMSTGEEFKSAFALWCKAWQQVPAGSLPDDDRVLAFLSGAGPRWKKVKAVALRNWIKCSDGRLYHPVVSEKAMEALPMRLEYNEKKTGEAERKAREREDRKRMFEQLRAAGVTPEYNTKTSDLRLLVTRHVTENVTLPVTPVTLPVTAKTGTGTGTESLPPTPAPPKRDKFAGQPEQVRRILEVGRFIAVPNDVHLLWEWLGLSDMELERDIVPIVEKAADAEMATKGRAPFTFKFFDSRVRQKHAEDEAAIAAMRRGRRLIEEQDAAQAAEREANAR